MARHQGMRRWLAGLPVLSVLIGCARESSAPAEAVGHPGTFRIQEIASTQDATGTQTVWLATAVRGTKTVTFGIELLQKGQNSDTPSGFTKGALVRKEEAGGSWFLDELAVLLGATSAPPKIPAEARLEFAAYILGTSLSRQGGPDVYAGAFTSKPPGHWIAIKIFVADGEGEFFLNLNPTDGVGEIAIKDEDYGDIVVGELAKVFLPNQGQ